MTEPEGCILDWDEAAVCIWLSNLGFSQYESQIKEHSISGEVLTFLDSEALKEAGIASVGQRLAILKAVYYAKLAHNVPIEPDHYVPPSEAASDGLGITLERLNEIVREQGERLQLLEQENHRLLDSFQMYMEDVGKTDKKAGRDDQPGLRRQPSFKWAQFVKPAKSPTKGAVDTSVLESPKSSPRALEHDIPPNSSTTTVRDAAPRNAPGPSTGTPPTAGLAPQKVTTNVQLTSKIAEPPAGTSDNLKTFKVSLDDPAWKVLPAALKKYKINNDDWQNYAMFICYGNTERCLSYDEKPLLLFQKLKEAKKNPVFMLKHIKDIRSPIAVAKQKQAARKSEANPAKQKVEGSRINHHPPAAKAAIAGPPPGPWPDVVSPNGTDALKATEIPMEDGAGKARSNTVGTSASDEDWVITPTGVSYAVAIYPYMAEQDDELDVVVGDYFIILQRARGWWNVQRDPLGTGVVDQDTSKQGWVPAGCLLETRVPVASAVAEAAANSQGSRSPTSPVGRTPILPLSIVSTSYPGLALMDYRKKGDEELDLSKDDLLRVFKRYNHWSYAVKEEGGDRGWVPSWFIGKATTSAISANGVPPTPSTLAPAGGPTTSNPALLDSELRYASNVDSPLSPAFPHAAQPPRTAGFI